MKSVKVAYNADTLETTITVDGKAFDTSRIDGKEIEIWAYPFMMRKIKWNGFYDEMVEALGGEKEFNLIFEGSESGLNELKEAWEDAPVHIVEENFDMPDAVIEYNEKNLTTKITVNGEEFDTSRINGKEIEDWVYPFMIRKVKWNGIFEELAKVIGSEEYIIEFSVDEKYLSILKEECPETVKIIIKACENKEESVEEITKPKSAEELYNEAKTLDEQYIYDQSFDLYKKSAEMGYTKSLFEMGKCYYFGAGIGENYQKAFEYFKKAADKNNSEAQYYIGVCYYNGKGIKKNLQQAVTWYRKAAEQGNADAQTMLGSCYYNGEGVTQNYNEAVKWFKRAAEQGNADAQTMLGSCYYNGEGVTQNYNEAVKWFKRAAEQGDEDAQKCLDKMNEDYDYDDDFEFDDDFESDDEESILKFIASIIEPDSLKEINNFFKKYSSTEIENYETLGDFVNQFFNLQIKRTNIYDDDYDYEPDNVAADEFLSKVKGKLGENVIINPLSWFCDSVLQVIVNKKPNNFKNTLPYISSVLPRLKMLISELKEDFDSNGDKIFELFDEIDRNSPEENYIVTDALYYYYSLEYEKNDGVLESINAKVKKKNIGLTAGSAVAGGLLSLVPFVGIPLALGASAVAGKVLGDGTDEEYEKEFKRYNRKIGEYFYNNIVIKIMWLVYDIFLVANEYKIEEQAGLNNIDFDEKDDFFDKI